jgi:hypothetical protein
MNQALVGVLSTLTALGAIGMMGEPEAKKGKQPEAPAHVATQPPATMTPAQQEALRQAFNLPPGSEVDVEIVNRDMGGVRTRQEGRGVGAGAVAEGDKLDQQFTGTPPIVGLGADGSLSGSGGGSDSDQKGSALKVPPMPWQNPLFWIGLGCLGACGFGVYAGLRRLALITGVAGVGLIAAAFYPVILLFAVGAVLVVVLGPYVYAEVKKRRAEKDKEATQQESDSHYEALRAVVGGVEHRTLPAEMVKTLKAANVSLSEADMNALVMRLQRNLKDAIAKEADGKDKEVIDEVKREDRVGKYAD